MGDVLDWGNSEPGFWVRGFWVYKASCKSYSLGFWVDVRS